MRGNARAWVTVVLLGLLYIVSFIDRTILALLVQPLKADLALNDVQLGLLFGTVFALFYALASLPIARIADRTNRKRLIMVGVLFWSVCTAASGFARNFSELAVLRLGLAIGEATLTPAAYSLITDQFSRRTGMRAATLFSTSGMLGSASAYLAGGALINLLEGHVAVGAHPQWAVWRLVFVLLGCPGILLTILLGIVAREPPRGADCGTVDAHAGYLHVVRHIKVRASLYGGLFLGAGLGQTCCNAVLAWGPTYLQRTYGYSVPASGYGFGVAQAFGAVAGTLVVPTLIDVLMCRRYYSMAALVPMFGAVAGSLLIAAAPFCRSPVYFLCAYALGAFLLIGASNSIIIILQQIAPPAFRATMTALSLICISSIGFGAGPPIVAVIARAASGATSPLAWGISIVAAASVVGALSLLWLAARPLRAALQGTELTATNA